MASIVEKHEGYVEDLPFKTQKWMRPDDPGSEIHPPRRYGDRTENERIIKAIALHMQRIDHTEKDNTMLYSPHWKNGYKTRKKWITKKGFDLTGAKFGSMITDKAAWS